MKKWRDEDSVMDMYKVRLGSGEVKEFTEEGVLRFIPDKEEAIFKPISTKSIAQLEKELSKSLY